MISRGESLHILMAIVVLVLCAGCAPETTGGIAPTASPAATSVSNSPTGLSVTPSATTLAWAGQVQFMAGGGSGSYTWSMAGGTGSINSQSGLFTAPQADETDIIQAVDTSGNIVSATVVVTNTATAITGVGFHVSIQAQSGYYFSAANGGGSNITVDRTSASSWETFTFADQTNANLTNGDLIYIQANNGDYVSAHCGGGSSPSNLDCGTVTADRTSASTWETFTIVKQGGSAGSQLLSGDTFSLISANGTFCSADIYGGGPGSIMTCNRTSASAWETFALTLAP